MIIKHTHTNIIKLSRICQPNKLFGTKLTGGGLPERLTHAEARRQLAELLQGLP